MIKKTLIYELVEILNNYLRGQKFTNCQHSNREGETYQIQKVFSGLYDLEIEVQYSDGVTESFDLSQVRDDIKDSELEQQALNQQRSSQSQPKLTHRLPRQPVDSSSDEGESYFKRLFTSPQPPLRHPKP